MIKMSHWISQGLADLIQCYPFYGASSCYCSCYFPTGWVWLDKVGYIATLLFKYILSWWFSWMYVKQSELAVDRAPIKGTWWQGPHYRGPIEEAHVWTSLKLKLMMSQSKVFSFYCLWLESSMCVHWVLFIVDSSIWWKYLYHYKYHCVQVTVVFVF